jgi:hypothetical protein
MIKENSAKQTLNTQLKIFKATAIALAEDKGCKDDNLGFEDMCIHERNKEEQHLLKNGSDSFDIKHLSIPIIPSFLRYFTDKNEICHGSGYLFHSSVSLKHEQDFGLNTKAFLCLGHEAITGKEKVGFDIKGVPYLTQPTTDQGNMTKHCKSRMKSESIQFYNSDADESVNKENTGKNIITQNSVKLEESKINKKVKKVVEPSSEYSSRSSRTGKSGKRGRPKKNVSMPHSGKKGAQTYKKKNE